MKTHQMILELSKDGHQLRMIIEQVQHSPLKWRCATEHEIDARF